jgi:hypothetical protein
MKFGYWGNYPHWLCTLNNAHRQRVVKAHLSLPKMRSLIPKKEQGKVTDEKSSLDD